LTWSPYLDENGNPPPGLEETYEERTEEEFRVRMRNIHRKQLEGRGIERRDSCLAGQVYEMPGHDYFGYGH
jgi:hypothetical protein